MRRITVSEEDIATLFGSYDENLRHLESKFDVRIRTQGHELIAEGKTPGPERVERVVGQLSTLAREGFKLTGMDVQTAADLVARDPDADLRDHFLKGSLTPAGRRIALAHGEVVERLPNGPGFRASWLISHDDLDATAADYVALGHWNRYARVGRRVPQIA